MPHLLVRPLAAVDAEDAARLHMAGQPGTFLTALGQDVLTVVYRSLPATAGCFGFAALRSDPDELVGYISATTGIGGLFVEMATRRLGDLAPPLLRRYGQRPELALRSLQTALYPLFVHDDESSAAELLSIMVEPEARSHGIGGLLMAAFLQNCRNRDLHAVTVTVDADNEGAQRFYARCGFVLWRSMTLYGRRMHLYRRSI